MTRLTWKDLAGKFHLAQSQRPAFARRADPAQEETEQLPERVEPETARHDRIALEVAGKEPEIGLEFQHGANQALAIFAAGLRDLRNAVEHQHRGERQLGIARAEQFSSPARQ
jgi:hypothetical protein